MDIDIPTPLLGGLSARVFMRRHWQKKPLLVRQAWPGLKPPVQRSALFELASQEDVESRLIQQQNGRWSVRQGPLRRRALPPLNRPGWTLLVQGLDLHVDAAHDMLSQFRFVPQARLDDLMISYATDGGGVGAHLDSYDVFLLQVHGRRRWRIGRVAQPQWMPDTPLKLLANFEPQAEWVLEPGDMLYLPPLWGHAGVAKGECMTCSIGFQAQTPTQMARDLLEHAVDALDVAIPERLYRDPHQSATTTPGRIPENLATFAHKAIERVLLERDTLNRALGESLTETKPLVWFDTGATLMPGQGARLDRRSRMMYDDRHVFINGESFRAGGRDASLMRGLADRQCLTALEIARLSNAAQELLSEWVYSGWLQPMLID